MCYFRQPLLCRACSVRGRGGGGAYRRAGEVQYGACRCCTFSNARQLECPLPLQTMPLEAVRLLVDLLIPRLCGGMCYGHDGDKALCMLDEALLLFPLELDVARKVAAAHVGLHLRVPPSGSGGGAGDDPSGRRWSGGHGSRQWGGGHDHHLPPSGRGGGAGDGHGCRQWAGGHDSHLSPSVRSGGAGYGPGFRRWCGSNGGRQQLPTGSGSGVCGGCSANTQQGRHAHYTTLGTAPPLWCSLPTGAVL